MKIDGPATKTCERGEILTPAFARRNKTARFHGLKAAAGRLSELKVRELFRLSFPVSTAVPSSSSPRRGA